MSKKLKSQMKELGKGLLQALAAGLAAWLATTFGTGCTTVITTSDDAPSVCVTGAITLGLQLNNKRKEHPN